MSKQPNDGGSTGWNSSQSSINYANKPSVGRFSNDHKVSLYTKGPSAKFNDNDRNKSMMAPRSNPGHPSPQPSTLRPATNIEDLTAPDPEWKAMKPANASHSTQK